MQGFDGHRPTVGELAFPHGAEGALAQDFAELDAIVGHQTRHLQIAETHLLASEEVRFFASGGS